MLLSPLSFYHDVFLGLAWCKNVKMLYSQRVTSREVNITFYQRTLLGTSANQKRHLKSNNIQLMRWIQSQRIYKPKNNIFTSASGLGKNSILGLIV